MAGLRPGSRRRRAWAAWSDLLRHHELRVVSGPPDAPYAATVVGLTGQVVVQVERRFWRETPGPLREAALRAHAAQVREEVGALGSLEDLVPWAVLGVRGAASAPALLKLGLSGTLLELSGALALAPLLVGLFRPGWLLWPVRAWVRRRLRRAF